MKHKDKNLNNDILTYIIGIYSQVYLNPGGINIIKDKNGKDVSEAEGIRKWWQEYTELYKKDFNDLDNHDSVIIHLEPDILEFEVKWA